MPLYNPSSGGSEPNIATTDRAQATSETIAADQTAVVVRKYTIATGTKLTLASGSALRIL